MSINRDLTTRTERPPDAARPPLQIIWTIGDDGVYSAEISFGGVNPFRAGDLVAAALQGILDECRRMDLCHDHALDTIEWHVHQIGGPLEFIANYIEHQHTKGLTDAD